MARPEAGLWDFLRARMPVGTHYSRIESLETAPGFPDVHYTLQSITGGMELKCNPDKVKGRPFAGKNGLRKTQLRWIDAEIAAGGKVILVLQYLTCIYFVKGVWFEEIAGYDVDDLEQTAEFIWDRTQYCDGLQLYELMKARN